MTSAAQWIGGTRFGVWAIKRIVSPLQRRLLQLTGGRVSLTGRAPVLLLTTTGRRSGKERTTPLLYLRDGERVVVCNVNPGFERPNPWTLNLRATPEARVRIGGHSMRCRAREATPSEVGRYWPQFVELWPAYQAFFDRSGQRTLFVLEDERVSRSLSAQPALSRSSTSGGRTPPRLAKLAWKVIVVADVGVLLYGVLAATSPSMVTAGYESFTGRPWDYLRSVTPDTARFLLLVFRLVGGLNVALAVTLIAVASGPFRRGERWAWFTLLAGNAIGFGAPITYDQLVGSIGPFELLELLAIGAVLLSLAVAARWIHPFQRDRTGVRRHSAARSLGGAL